MLLLVLNAAAVAEPEWATAFRQLQEQVASLQGRVTSLETENAVLRRQAGRSLEPALTRVETQGLGASRRLSESAPSCCRWTASGECGSNVTKECTRMPLWIYLPRLADHNLLILSLLTRSRPTPEQGSTSFWRLRPPRITLRTSTRALAPRRGRPSCTRWTPR